jgi:hypothetical protein
MELEGSLPPSQEPSTGPILSQIDPIPTIPSYLSKINFNNNNNNNNFIITNLSYYLQLGNVKYNI